MIKSKSWFIILIYLLYWIPIIGVQPFLTTGDMGRDFYAFEATLHGLWPCRDYWWQYGPLMPLYYAFWFLVGGVNLLSIRIGLAVLYFLCALSTHATLRLFVSSPVAFLSSLAFLSFNMTWTFNHIGIIPLFILLIFSVWKFFLTLRLKWCYAGLLLSVLIAWIKINIGITSFAAFYASLLLYDLFRPKTSGHRLPFWKHWLALPLGFSAGFFALYGLLYSGLSLDWVNQCLTIQPKYSSWSPPWINFKHLILRFLVWERMRLIGLGLFLMLGILAWRGLKKQKETGVPRKLIPWILISLALFITANSADYFAKDDKISRLDFWAFPVLVLWMGLLVQWATPLFGPKFKKACAVLILGALFWIPFHQVKAAFAWHTPERYLNFPRGRVFVGGDLSDVGVIKEGTFFLMEHSKPGGEILALPYDPLYAFLSERRHAVRELMFMEGILIGEKQEDAIIHQLETKQVPWVIFSNRDHSEEMGIGHFGKTHCKKLADYIFSHYREVKTLGPWDSAGQHALKIFERK